MDTSFFSHNAAEHDAWNNYFPPNFASDNKLSFCFCCVCLKYLLRLWHCPVVNLIKVKSKICLTKKKKKKKITKFLF